MKTPNRFQVALALSRRLDRLDPASAAEAEAIINAVEAGSSINAPLRTFFADAWERLGRAAVATENSREMKVAIGHLAALTEVSDALGFGPVEVPVEDTNSHEIVQPAETETEHVSVTETAQTWS